MTLLSSDEPLDTLLAKFRAPEREGIDLGLERVLALLDSLGNPHLRLPPVVHVAGTNGKGSTLAFLRALLEAHGKTVHVYTSPHLVRFHERIVVKGKPIEDSLLRALLAEVVAATHVHPATFFEVATAVAFLAFARTPADVVLLETGMGGRLDATNVVPNPAATAITPIGLDHMEFLGDTLAAIAAEKAGILKPGIPCVVAPQAHDAREAILAMANAIHAPVVEAGPDDVAGLPLGLTGPHQAVNAAVALGLFRALGLEEDAARIQQGLAAASWPARLQRLAGHPYEALLPSGGTLWLDGGHNPAAADMLAQWAVSEPTTLVLGMMGRKDARAFLAPFRGVVDAVHAVPIPGEECHSPQILAVLAEEAGISALAYDDVEQALTSIHEPSRVLICGSLYLAGVVLRAQS